MALGIHVLYACKVSSERCPVRLSTTVASRIYERARTNGQEGLRRNARAGTNEQEPTSRSERAGMNKQKRTRTNERAGTNKPERTSVYCTTVASRIDERAGATEQERMSRNERTGMNEQQQTTRSEWAGTHERLLYHSSQQGWRTSRIDKRVLTNEQDWWTRIDEWVRRTAHMTYFASAHM